MMFSAAPVLALLLAVQIGVPVASGRPSAADDPGAVAAEAAVWSDSLPGLGLGDRLLLETAVESLEGVPFAAGLVAADYLWVERTLQSLTLREKVAQLVVPYIEGGRPGNGTAAWRRARRLVMEEKVGGFIVGVGPSYETARWLNELQSVAEVPLLMTADLEWGPGTRLRGATVLPINMAIAAAGSPRLAFEAGRITGMEARAAGLHLAFAPVADVNVNPLNPVINTRAYGSDAAAGVGPGGEVHRGCAARGASDGGEAFPRPRRHGDRTRTWRCPC
jgi:hypothetical protein